MTRRVLALLAVAGTLVLAACEVPCLVSQTYRYSNGEKACWVK